MNSNPSRTPYLLRPLASYFLVGLIIVNVVAIFPFDPLYIGAFFSFIYILVTPGFLSLPLLTKRKFSWPFGVALSVALSILMLMLTGLALNTFLPVVGMYQPLSTVPLLVTFDTLVYILLVLNYEYKENSPFEFHDFDRAHWLIVGAAALLPVLACVGAIELNDGGPNYLTMLALVIAAVLVPIVLFAKKKMPSSIPPVVLYLAALSFLLMNSMRGWFITGHDILLEYHVFTLANDNHRWIMSLYQDPYNACLSLTIFPTYLENLLHVGTAYIFKFFIQFIGALPVVTVYYLTKEYVSEKTAFLAGFLYITFPTFMVDMAFLNRQGVAFLFFGAMIFVLLTTEYISGWKRHLALVLFGAGVILSHYSTSYITIALLIGGYIINRVLRLIVRTERPGWLCRFTTKLGNREVYDRPILLTLPFVIGLLALMVIWSSVITKTSTSLFNTIEQIVVSVEHPFSFDQSTGPAQYSLLVSKQPSPQELFDQFLKDGLANQKVAQNQSQFFPASIVDKYPTSVVAETFAPLTSFGEGVQALVHIDLNDLYNDIKQAYAKILQLLIIVGLAGMLWGLSFKKNLLRNVPVEYIALSISGLAVMVGQTVLPASAIDYGLLRLFQQNLTLLALPIMLGFISVGMIVTRSHRGQVVISTLILVSFFIILSGLFPQLTGGGRPLLPLNNDGLYYVSYYTHAQEVASAQWVARHGDPHLPIQAAHFSDIKMIAYGHIGSYIELLPQTTKRNSYVYLNYDNVKSSNIIEIINGDVVYYHFPLAFLEDNKDLIYNNGGSEIYR